MTVEIKEKICNVTDLVNITSATPMEYIGVLTTSCLQDLGDDMKSLLSLS